MYNFNATNKLRKNALKLVASTLTAADVQRLRTVFHQIDTDTTQTISVSELAVALRRLGLPAGQGVEKLMAQMDFDDDGTLNLEEFLVATSEMQMIYHQNNIWWAFCEYDTNRDGTITVQELRAILADEPEEDIRKYMAEYDLDKDGRINYEVRCFIVCAGGRCVLAVEGQRRALLTTFALCRSLFACWCRKTLSFRKSPWGSAMVLVCFRCKTLCLRQAPWPRPFVGCFRLKCKQMGLCWVVRAPSVLAILLAPSSSSFSLLSYVAASILSHVSYYCSAV